MSCLGNVLWFIFCGFAMSITWAAFGILWCVTIIGIPIGKQCFKFALLCLFPFGVEIRYEGGNISMFLNVIWFLVSGLALAIEAAAIGCALCATIIGIPFGLQCFKIAKLALMPFGSRVV